LVWIRIRGSTGSGSCYFVIDLQDTDKKLIKKKFFCLLLFEGIFTLFFKDKESKTIHKTVRIKVFLTNLLDDRRMIEVSGSRSTALTNGSGSGSGTLGKIMVKGTTRFSSRRNRHHAISFCSCQLTQSERPPSFSFFLYTAFRLSELQVETWLC
jgi:hypothetical protein